MIKNLIHSLPLAAAFAIAYHLLTGIQTDEPLYSLLIVGLVLTMFIAGMMQGIRNALEKYNDLPSGPARRQAPSQPRHQPPAQRGNHNGP